MGYWFLIVAPVQCYCRCRSSGTYIDLFYGISWDSLYIDSTETSPLLHYDVQSEDISHHQIKLLISLQLMH
jgi:hypothetical protein